MLLGDDDYSDIKFVGIPKFRSEKHKPVSLIDGYITLNICREGGDRLLISTVQPSINVEVSPTQHLLNLTSICNEEGVYTLSIVDMLGNVNKIHEFYAKPTEQTEYKHEHSIINFPNGSYYIILSSPSKTYNNNFIIAK